MSARERDDLAAWDGAASTYASVGHDDSFDEFLARYVGDVRGKRVLDLGCGDGWFASQLQERGAEVLAVDGSAALIDIGKQRYPNVEFELADLRNGIEGQYDVVAALMVLMDVPDLSRLRPRVAPGGVFVATLLHPAFFNQRTVDDGDGGYREVRGYLDEDEWWIETFGGHRHYHRPLGAYVEWISALGLGVVELYEPRPPRYDGWRSRIPTRLGIAARPLPTAR